MRIKLSYNADVGAKNGRRGSLARCTGSLRTGRRFFDGCPLVLMVSVLASWCVFRSLCFQYLEECKERILILEELVRVMQ